MSIDNLITRFPNGVTNAADNAGFNNLKIPDRSIYHEFLEDFDKFTAAEWNTGGEGAPTAPQLVVGDGGQIEMINSAADGDNNWLQQFRGAWTLEPGKRLFFKARLSLNAETFGAVVAGLQIPVAADDILTPTDGLFLRKNGGESGMHLISRVGDVETDSGEITPGPGFAVGQFVDIFFVYDGQGRVIAGSDNQPRTVITPVEFTPDVLGIVVGVQNTSAATRVLVVDQIFVAKEH